ncbi:hypothetical protein [Aestuariicoccus sp. MJ-SS9]|uniref:hypothetical protein n=1 Tax=Aestuariicoccus sp. MJ-SS9 TaxID=3079855 RepID=UPI0029132256|nr:hypothetical protein [Aestuariicoccus sp. MJ-SS9]MDU8909969.1 hypothetical protein [Aestuariicoccus sp. MJ-SS9]
MTTDKRKPDTGLEEYFAAARDAAPLPPGDLLARIEADALAEQAALARPRRAGAVPSGLWADLRQALGGWPAFAGLAASACVGLWIGVSPPASVAGLWPASAAELTGDTLDPVSGFDFVLVEG